MRSARIVRPDNRQPTQLANVRLVQCNLRDTPGIKEFSERSIFTRVFFFGAQSLPASS